MSNQLDIMNAMLRVIGEIPVTKVDSKHPSARSAAVLLAEEVKSLCLHRWWFNMEYKVSLNPNNSGTIMIPGNTVAIEFPRNNKFIARGTKLYDPVNRTDIFTSPVKVNLQILLDTEEMPFHAVDYLKDLCVFKFYRDNDGDIDKLKNYESQVLRSWALLRAEDLKQSPVNAHERVTVQNLLGGHLQAGGSYNPMYPGGRFR